ncbi:MAG: hypothetical protein K8S13_09340 [Desulfobacula sp.]|nr:hypothetical protein [Desulfobacula sp.]
MKVIKYNSSQAQDVGSGFIIVENSKMGGPLFQVVLRHIIIFGAYFFGIKILLLHRKTDCFKSKTTFYFSYLIILKIDKILFDFFSKDLFQ